MNLKALREKRNSLLTDLNNMVEAIETEVRSLTDEEVKAFGDKKAEIEKIDADIKRVEELRALSMGSTKEEIVEKRSQEEMEKRALENFLRGMDLTTEEKRVLQSTANTSAFLPQTIHKTIIEKLQEQCPILDKAKRFSTKGTLRLIKENDIKAASVKAENQAFDAADPEFATVELKSYKIATTVQITFEMLANSDIDLSGYLSDLVVRRLSIALNRLFINGTDTNTQPQGIAHYAKNAGQNINKVTVSAAAGLKITDLIKLQTSINPYYLNGAVFVMSRPVFQHVASMLDSMGRPYLTQDVINNKVVYRLLGLEIMVDENMDTAMTTGKVPVIMANLGECYAVNMVKDITVKHMTEKGFTQGFEEFGAYVLADGKVINEQAIAHITMTA